MTFCAHLNYICIAFFCFISEGDKLASTVQKNISELAVSLLHLQQNIAIPEISLPIHPIIQDAVKLASREDRKPTVEDIGDNLSDATFLNALQKQVANWTREIRRVCVSLHSILILISIYIFLGYYNAERCLLRYCFTRDQLLG